MLLLSLLLLMVLMLMLMMLLLLMMLCRWHVCCVLINSLCYLPHLLLLYLENNSYHQHKRFVSVCAHNHHHHHHLLASLPCLSSCSRSVSSLLRPYSALVGFAKTLTLFAAVIVADVVVVVVVAVKVDLADIVANEVTCKTPLLLVSRPGYDASSKVDQLASQVNAQGYEVQQHHQQQQQQQQPSSSITF